MTQPTPFLPRDLRELRGLLLAVTACEAVGAAGGTATARSTKQWLPTLDLPSYQPPGWVFGPVRFSTRSWAGPSTPSAHERVHIPARPAVA